jgi:hypothetical protein
MYSIQNVIDSAGLASIVMIEPVIITKLNSSVHGMEGEGLEGKWPESH